jgi:osmotically-inducible protein OsmY
LTRFLGLVGLVGLICVAGCGPNEEQKQRIADAAVAKAEEQARVMSERLRGTYDDAYAKGREIAGQLGGTASDQVLKAKVLGAFKLMSALDSSNVKVKVEKGVIYLDGTLKTEHERMMAEGLAYGVVGDGKRVRSTLTVPK